VLEVLGDLALDLGLAGDADARSTCDALELGERARGELPQAVEGVRGPEVGGRGGAAGAKLVQGLDHLGELLRPMPGTSRSSERVSEATAPTVGSLACSSAARTSARQRELCTGSGESHEVRDQRRVDADDGGDRGHATRAQGVLEGDDVVCGLGADRVDGAHLAGGSASSSPAVWT
jgi:hypothetical protein